VTNAEPATYVTEKKPAAVRVTTDSMKTVITHPRVAGDSLVGVTSTSTGIGTTREDSTGVALAAIRKLEVPRAAISGLEVVSGVALVVLLAVFFTSMKGDITM
jgi:hypothetical protein